MVTQVHRRHKKFARNIRSKNAKNRSLAELRRWWKDNIKMSFKTRCDMYTGVMWLRRVCSAGLM